MTPLISTDSFDAFSVDNGILIKEKKKSAKKMGIIVTVMGIIFLMISFIRLDGIVPAILSNVFYYVFRWGGILLAALGIITFVVKGLLVSNADVLVDTKKREVNLRGTPIPFAQINSITMQSQDVMGRRMTVIILDHAGKKKAFISGSLILEGNQSPALEQFVHNINYLVRS